MLQNHNKKCLRTPLKCVKTPAPSVCVPCRHNTQHRVILLPEVPPDTAETNPILKHYGDGLPEFGSISQANCFYGLGKVLLEFESAVCQLEDAIEAGEKDWSVMLEMLERKKLQLENVRNIVQLLHITTASLDEDRFRQLYQRAERAYLTRQALLRQMFGIYQSSW